MKLRFCIVMVLFWFAIGPATAGDLEDALAAHDAGKYEAALELLLPLGESGNVDAQNKLSHMYWYGKGTPSNYVKALGWSRRAAEQGSPAAQYDIGVHYSTGLGVDRDLRRAFEWFSKAADQNFGRAEFNVALMYLNGHGVTMDTSQWLFWLRRSTEHGEPMAQLMTARLQLMSSTPSSDEKETDRLLQSAAAQLDAEAQYVLAGLFLDGASGWPQDTSQAYFWFSLARQLGCIEATAQLERLALQLSSAQITAADELAAQWREMHPAPAGRVHPVKLKSCELTGRLNG